MDLTSAVDWWEEWQLRVLVLTSLALRWLLFLGAPLRKLAIPSLLRFLIWIIYLGSDAVAIYALATLFNRHKESGVSSARGDSGLLEVMWAPVLLWHLGGVRRMTAYNIEDNELWLRQVVTAVSQITVAIYVFCKSWPTGGDKQLLTSSILVFVVGFINIFLRPAIFHISSVTGQSSMRPGWMDPGGRYRRPHWHDYELPRYVEVAKRSVIGCGDDPCPTDVAVEGAVELEPRMLILDFLPRYEHRLDLLRSFLMDKSELYTKLQNGLSVTFDSLYTIQKRVKIPRKNLKQILAGINWVRFIIGFGFHILVPYVALGLFHPTKDPTAGMMSSLHTPCSTVQLCCIYLTLSQGWIHIIIPRQDGLNRLPNITSYDSSSERRASGLRRSLQYTVLLLLNLSHHCDLFLKPLYSLESRGPSSSRAIIKLVDVHLKRGWKEYIHDAASYREFNALRGQGALRRNNCEDISYSLEIPFDESVLLWHIATDFCFYHLGESSGDHQCATAIRSRELSNYMMHLLYENPEMLMVGTRRYLFTEAYVELKDIFRKKPPAPAEERKLTHEITEAGRDGRIFVHPDFGGGIIYPAYRLARSLFDLGDEKMWGVIEGVWVEMLCFSAGRCRGYLHGKALGEGGELLTYVWLLMSYMGMETLAERLQRSELPSRQGKTSAEPSTSEDCTGEAATAADPLTSEVHSGSVAAPSTSEVHGADGHELV